MFQRRPREGVADASIEDDEGRIGLSHQEGIERNWGSSTTIRDGKPADSQGKYRVAVFIVHIAITKPTRPNTGAEMW